MTASWVLQTCLLLTCLQQLVAATSKPDSQTISPQHQHLSLPNATQQAYQPAITGIATTTLFAYASKVALEVVEDQFDKLDLPDTSSSWDIPVIGTINLDLSRIVLKSLDISAATTGVAPNQQGGVTFIVIGLRTTVDCHFHYYKDTFPKVSGSGDAEVHFENGNVEFKLIPKADAKGRPMIISQGPAKVSFGDIDVRTSHSKAAWLYNLFLNVFEGQFRGVITREVARQITLTLPREVNKLLAGVPTVVDLEGFQFNTSLAGDPIVDPTQITVKDWGRFRLTGAECPYERPTGFSIPHAIQASNMDEPPMFIARIDETIIDCFTWVLQQKGLLKRHFTSSEVPIALDTNNWAAVVPQLVAKYPNQKMMLDVATAEPLLTRITHERGVVTSGNATLSFLLDSQDPSKKGKGLFALAIQSEIAATKVWVESGKPKSDWRLMVRLEVISDSIQVQVLSSSVGHVNAAALQSSIRYLAGNIMQQWVNDTLLRDGFALPDIPFVRVQQPAISFEDAYLSVEADVQYVPSL